jgi:hypothetical protein
MAVPMTYRAVATPWGQTALSWAALAGNVTAVRLLLVGGSEVDALDADGAIPLIGAALDERAGAHGALACIRCECQRSCKERSQRPARRGREWQRRDRADASSRRQRP